MSSDRAPLDPRLVRRARAVRRQLAVSVLAGGLEALLIVAQAWLLAFVVARGFHQDGLGHAVVLAVVAVGVVLATRAGSAWVVEVAGARAATETKTQLRADLVDALLRPRREQARDTGATIAVVGPGLDALDPYLARYLPQLVLAFVVPAVMVVALASTDLLSAATVAITLPLVVLFMVLVGLLTRERTERRWQAMKRLAHHFTDVLAGLTVLTVHGRAAGQADGLRAVGDRHRRTTVAALRLAFLSALVLELVATISVALVAVSVGLRVVDGRMGLQSALFVLLLAPEAYLPIRRLGAQFHDSEPGRAAAADALAVIEAAPPQGGAPAPDPARAAVVLEAVSVVYPDRDRPVLDPIDLELRPGRIVALAGPSGSGKSTLLRVVLGLQAPTSGRVSIDGTDLADIDPTAWHRRVAWVPQQPTLFAGTVADNVRLAADDATPDEVRAVLAAAGAAGIEPGRVVVDTDHGLSAGEVRRVALARALLRVRRGATLLVLDEPTAGLDDAAEAEALAAVRSSGVGALVVAHRPAVLDACDDVVRLDRAPMPELVV